MVVDLPPGGLEEAWWPWVAAGVGVAAGLLVTLTLLWLMGQLLHLCLSDCSVRRAWPNSCCWRNVSITLWQGPSLETMRPLFFSRPRLPVP